MVGLDKQDKIVSNRVVRKFLIQHLLLSVFPIRKLGVLGAGLIFLLSVSLTSVIIVLSSNQASANHQEDVLGVASAPVLSIPPTSEGPGLILPSSPLFFLDRLKQEFRLLLAFTPEQKANVHNLIAGERLAELRLMLARNNVPGIRTALQGVSDNLKAASGDLANAKLTGRNINLLSKEINDSIKEKQKSLSVLEGQAAGEIRAQVTAAKEALKIAKVAAEENLPTDLMINETIDDLNLEIDDNVKRAKVSAAGINRAIDVLTRLASEAAVKNQSAREAALKRAIEVKNTSVELQDATVNLEKEMSLVVVSSESEKTLRPHIDSMSAASGSSNDVITIKGKNLIGTKDTGIFVEFLQNGISKGTQSSGITTQADGLSLTLKLSGLNVENMDPGLYKIRIVNSNGESNAVDFAISNKSLVPSITSISPASGSSNDVITIKGKNLIGTKGTGIFVEFLQNGISKGTQSSGITTQADGLSLTIKLSGILLRNIDPGSHQIRVVNNNGESNTVDFTILSE